MCYGVEPFLSSCIYVYCCHGASTDGLSWLVRISIWLAACWFERGENHPSWGKSCEKSQTCEIIILCCALSGKVWHSCVLRCVFHVLSFSHSPRWWVRVRECVWQKLLYHLYMQFFIAYFNAYMLETHNLKNCIYAWKHAIKNCMYKWSSWWWRRDVRNT